MTSDRVGYGQIEFKSLGPPILWSFYLRFWLIIALPLAGFAFLLDQDFWRDPLGVGLIVTLPLTLAFGVPRMSKGRITLDIEGVTQKSGGRTIRYAWGDIKRMFVTTIKEKGSTVTNIYRLAGLDVDKEYIEVTLKKSLRVNPMSEYMSTRGWGLPTLVMRATHLYADDPHALLAAANVHLQPGLHA